MGLLEVCGWALVAVTKVSRNTAMHRATEAEDINQGRGAIRAASRKTTGRSRMIRAVFNLPASISESADEALAVHAAVPACGMRRRSVVDRGTLL